MELIFFCFHSLELADFNQTWTCGFVSPDIASLKVLLDFQVTHKFKMEMTCGGCSAAAERVLSRCKENKNIVTDLEKQEVTVTSTLPSEDLLETLKKTGKTVSYIGPQ